MAMNISSTTAASVALQGVQNTDGKRAALQLALLKKALDSQQSDAAQMLKLMDGKGQNLDIRV
jgi:hypothetical protein